MIHVVAVAILLGSAAAFWAGAAGLFLMTPAGIILRREAAEWAADLARRIFSVEG